MTALCSSYLFPSRTSSPGRLFRGDLQIIERGDGIGLCPQAHFARVLERVVDGLDFLVAVVVTSDLVSSDLHAQFVPFSRRNLEVGSGELTPATVHYVIEPVIVLQRVGANDVLVVRIFQAKN